MTKRTMHCEHSDPLCDDCKKLLDDMSDHTDDQRAELREKLSNEIVNVALRIKAGTTPITPSTWTDHVAGGRAILRKHHEGLDAIMQLFDAECAERERLARIDELEQARITPWSWGDYSEMLKKRIAALKSGAAGKDGV
jgi:hypothetical protein